MQTMTIAPALLRPGAKRPLAPKADVQHEASRPIAELWNKRTPNARIDGGSVTLPMPTGTVAKLPPLPLALDEPATPAIEAALDAAEALTALAALVARARADETLSIMGRQQAVDGAAVATIVTIGHAAARLARAEQAIDEREAKLVAEPEAPTEWAPAARDREVRDALSRMPLADALAAVQAAVKSGAAEVVRAVLTAPLPMPEPLVKHAREVWAADRKLKYPDEAAAIARERVAAEWARHTLAVVGSMAVQLASTFGKFDTADRLVQAWPTVTPEAAWPFAMSREQLATVKSRVEAVRVAQHAN